MIKKLCSKSSITADTASRKDLTLQGCNKVSTRTYTLVVRSGRYKITKHTQRYVDGVSDTTFPRPKASTGGHPTKLPATKLAGSGTDPGFASVAVNDWEPETLGLVDTAKTLPFQNSTRAVPRTI